MNSTINLSFRLSQRDYVRAMRAHYAKRLSWRRDGAFIIVAIIAGIYLWGSGYSRSTGIFLLGAAGFLSLVLLSAFTVIPILAFRRESRFGDEHLLTFSPRGIHFKTSKIDSDIQWALYSSALIDARSYVLYYGKESFTIIPKRVFEDASQQEVFEQLVEKNIPRIVKTDSVKSTSS